MSPADYGGLRLNCMQPLHAIQGIGHSITLTMPDFKGTLGDTLWREGSCLLPTLLAASGLLLNRVLPTAVSRPPAAPTA